MRPWWSRLLWRPRPTSSSTRSPSRPRDPSVVSPRPVARLLLDETDRIALRVGDRGDGRTIRQIEGLDHDGRTELRGTLEGRSEIAHLHVEAHGRLITCADVAGRSGLGSAEPGFDLHDRSVADGPVEQLAVEGGLAFGVDRHDLPLDHRTRPVAHRAHPRTTRSGAAA